jgi:hypothetical protein
MNNDRVLNTESIELGELQELSDLESKHVTGGNTFKFNSGYGPIKYTPINGVYSPQYTGDAIRSPFKYA